MSEQTTDPGRDNAWGDTMMPEEAARRQSEMEAARRQSEMEAARRQSEMEAPALAHADPPTAPDPSPLEYAFGATAPQPKKGIGYASLPLGPGNEAMEGGASPAPRGYTGGAMGKFVAGLSPSFAEAARGEPPPGGDQFYTTGEAATTFGPGSGIAHPTAQPPPEQAPAERPNSLDVPTDSGTG